MSTIEKLIDAKLITKAWADFTSAFALLNAKVFFNEYYPDNFNVFRALNECPPDKLKVVILGQD